MTRAALFFMIGTVILTAFYKKATYGPALSLAITFGTVSSMDLPEVVTSSIITTRSPSFSLLPRKLPLSAP